MPQHVIETDENPLRLHLAHKASQPVGIEHMRIQDDSPDVLEVLVELQSTLQHSLLLEHHCDLLLVKLVPPLHVKNGFYNLQGVHMQIEFQDLGLPRAILWLILLHALHQKGRHFFDAVLLQEDLGDSVDIDIGVLEIERLGGSQCALGVTRNHISEHRHVIHLDAGLHLILLRILNSSQLQEDLDQFGNAVGPLVNRDAQLLVVLLDQIPQLLRTGYLVLSQPVLNKLDLVLEKHGTNQFNGLLLVQLPFLQQRLEINQDGLRSRRRLQAFKSINGLSVSEQCPRRFGCNPGGTCEVLLHQQTVKLLHEHLIRSRQVILGRNLEG